MAKNGKTKEFSFVQSRGIILLAILFLFVLVLTFLFGDRGILEIVKMRKQIKTLEQTVKDLEKERNRLQQEVTWMRDNPLAVEQQAREKLWLMKKNEKVVVVKEKNKGEEKNE